MRSGAIRTEELLRADQYYGVDQQYFTSVIDYGFSKRLEEALVKWGREDVLRDVVRTIRMERPLVLVARFQGSDRDGHGNHQAAGLITQDAYRVAGDPSVFPDQIREGLRPWQPLKLYMGGVRPNEDWTIRVDPSVYSPWLGDTYANVARTGLSFQRSQNGGRNDPQAGPASAYYMRLASRVAAPSKETSFFDGIDTRLTSLFGTLGRPAPPVASALLEAIQHHVDTAVQAFQMTNPSAVVPALTQGLAATRDATQRLSADADAVYMLGLKERQFEEAINTALGIEFTATAQPPAAAKPSVPAAAPGTPATMDPVVRGQSFETILRFTNNGSIPVEGLHFDLSVNDAPSIEMGIAPSQPNTGPGETRSVSLTVTVPSMMPFTRPYFARASITESRYSISERDKRLSGHPWGPPPFIARAMYTVNGVALEMRAAVTRRESQLPYGYTNRELTVVPAVGVTIRPRQIVVPQANVKRGVPIQVELINNAPTGTTGVATLHLPEGWRAEPASIPFTFTRAGERAQYDFVVVPSAVESREYSVQAVAIGNGNEFTEGYDVIEHRDLETRYLYQAAISRVHGVDVQIAPGLQVGYVMGVGDDVPAGIAQLGARVTLLGPRDLATGDLSQYHAIVTGTRAYGVRTDLRVNNRRLLEYVRNGGNLIVFYNTPAEYDPNTWAPYPAQLPANAEEVSEEDSPIEILAPTRPEFTTPNVITKADFDGWVEQRGSKFFSQWDPAYTPMIETHDQGQRPQKGGWLTARYGKGHFTYFAYAFHRQLPYGVPGAFRLLANLLSMSKS
jgi:GlcNAc-PI de-N-acetylase